MLDKVQAGGRSFEDEFGNATFRGLTTGANDAFELTRTEWVEIANKSQGSEEVLRPWLRGREIKRWRVDGGDRYLILIQSSSDAGVSHRWSADATEPEAFDAFSKCYPEIAAHLARFASPYVSPTGQKKRGLRARSEQGKWWWELRSCAYYDAFSRPKVIWAKTSRRPAFAYDAEGYALANTAHFIAGAEPWVAGLLNGSVMEFVYRQRINLLRGGYVELTPDRLSDLKLPALNQAARDQLNILVMNITAENVTSTEEQIDSIVAYGSGVSATELDEIRAWLAERLACLEPEDALANESDDDDP